MKWLDYWLKRGRGIHINLFRVPLGSGYSVEDELPKFKWSDYWPAMQDDMRSLLGVPYQFGAKIDSWPPSFTDCSGLVEGLHSRRNIPCPHGSWNQHKESYRVSVARPGDVGFWADMGKRSQSNPFGIYHAGMLYDEDRVIEARAKDGDKYGLVILRPREKWEAWEPFKLAGGWRRLNVLRGS